MKKVLSLLLAGALCCGMAACGGEVPKVDNTTAATTAPVAQFTVGLARETSAAQRLYPFRAVPIAPSEFLPVTRAICMR